RLRGILDIVRPDDLRVSMRLPQQIGAIATTLLDYAQVFQEQRTNLSATREKRCSTGVARVPMMTAMCGSNRYPCIADASQVPPRAKAMHPDVL
ncbi:hypothetical protein, partial [Pseudomonas sp. AMR01]|uniref:hypothetical protein n=1 Tax=Pseudomonas sp. AMR01 TaxID=3064904 RepID=UPI0035BFA8C1